MRLAPFNLGRSSATARRVFLLGTVAASALSAGGCASDSSSTTATTETAELSTIDRLIAAMVGDKPAPQTPLTREEGIKLIEQIRANPARLQALSPREKLFLAKAAYQDDDDNF